MANGSLYGVFSEKLKNSISCTLSKNATALFANTSTTSCTKSDDGTDETVPEIGFKLLYNQSDNELKLVLIGARYLPVSIGLNSIQSFLIKVTLFPEKDKKEFHFDSKNLTSSLIRNESVTFKNQQLIQSNKFIVITIYTILNTSNIKNFLQSPKLETEGISKKIRSFFKRDKDTDETLKKTTIGFKRHGSIRKSNRITMENSRNIGNVTYVIDRKAFVQNLDKAKYLATLDIWRPLQNLSSGLNDLRNNDERNGSVEVTVKYSISEDGKNNMVCMCLNRIRFNKTLMHEYEKLKGRLYVKLMIYNDSISDNDKKRIAKWKSKQFDPTICMKFEPFTAIVQGFFEQNVYQKISLQIQLLIKNMFAQKTLLAIVCVQSKTSFWNEVFHNPSVPVTKWLPFERVFN